MDELIAKQRAAEVQQQFAQGLVGGSSNVACREKTQTIVAHMVGRHRGQLEAWTWLQAALDQVPPTEAQEASLWELVSSMRHQRY